jgi:hypothetical protein
MDVTLSKLKRFLGFAFRWACKYSTYPHPSYTMTDDHTSKRVELKVLRIKARRSVVVTVGEAAIGMTAAKAILLSDELVRAAVEVEPSILDTMSEAREIVSDTSPVSSPPLK